MRNRTVSCCEIVNGSATVLLPHPLLRIYIERIAMKTTVENPLYISRGLPLRTRLLPFLPSLTQGSVQVQYRTPPS